MFEQNCARAGNFLVPTSVPEGNLWTLPLRRAQSNPGYLPFRFLYVDIRMADSRGSMNIIYLVNPEVFGYAQDRRDWPVNDWNPSNSSARHQPILDRLRRWVTEIQPVAQRAYFDRATLSVPAW
jgi:hypothetical protein